MLTIGNSKLGDLIPNYNLPRTTCEKYKTVLCDKYCYAKRAHWNCKSVVNSMGRNLIESKKKNFVQLINAQIILLKIQKSIKYIRLHSSGDFYNQEYFNKWNEIARCNPDIKFLAYTRNYDIDFSNKVDNFNIFYSTDKTTIKMNNTLKQIAIVYNKNEKINDDTKICNSKCKTCKYCFNTKMNVNFIQH